MLGLTACGWFGSETPPPDPAPAAVTPAPVAPAPAPSELLAASHVLVAYAGAVGADPQVTRSAEEAEARAIELHGQLTAGAVLETVAAEASDDPSGGRGGTVGAFRVDAVDPAFAEAIASVAVGELTPPFRTQYGWHVARRDAVALPRGRHILVSYKGARSSSEQHDRAHARRMVDMLDVRLNRGGDFAELAAEFSNDATARLGGDLGPAGEGQLLPVLEQAITKLKPGQRTVVESAYGYHLVERTH